MIFKIAFFLLALFLIYLFFFKKVREKEIMSKTNKALEPEELMIECPTCKVFVSRKEAILSNASYYCCKECLR